MVEYCEHCHKILIYEDEKDEGLCRQCMDEEEGLNLASSIIHTQGFGAVDIDDF